MRGAWYILLDMDYRWLPPSRSSREASWIWLYLHGAYSSIAVGADGFEVAAAAAGAHLLLPQATRRADSGFLWSFAADAAAIGALLERECEQRGLQHARVAVVGHSMGCTMALWVLRQCPLRCRALAAIGMGSAFEPWHGDDGGFPLGSLSAAALGTRVLLAVDVRDPAGATPHVAGYFDANLARLRQEGFQVEAFRPDRGTHAVTAEMRERVAAFLQTP
jgi:pimeloyl-ACP methyl ester carboxylesterase